MIVYTVHVKYAPFIYHVYCTRILFFQGTSAPKILRGAWFLENSWQPLEEKFSDQIERDHLQKFEDHKLEDEMQEMDKPKGQIPGLFKCEINLQNKKFR